MEDEGVSEFDRAGVYGSSPVFFGRFSYSFTNLSIEQWGEGAALHIGAFCSIGGNVRLLLGGNHRMEWVSTYPFGQLMREHLGGENNHAQSVSKGGITIGSDVWIGRDVTVMSGITIGAGAVIATNSHVVKDVKPYEVVGGNPARHIKMRFTPDIIELLLQLRWWDLPVEEIRKINPLLCASPDAQLLREWIAQYRSVAA